MSKETGHWYKLDGTPMHWIAKKDGTGDRATTLADAKKLGLLPSVTGILKLLNKPALQNWITRQCVMAVVTAPDIAGEDIDAKIARVLDAERQQDREAEQAADTGTQIHAGLEAYFTGQPVAEDMKPWVMPVAEAVSAYGKLVAAEKILVGDGYAGKTDLILDAPECWWIFDYKSTKKLPDPKKGGAWPDHLLQLSAYAKAYDDLVAQAGPLIKPIRTGNAYVSSVVPGQYVICEHEGDWQDTYTRGFAPLVIHWQYSNKYAPTMPARVKVLPPPTEASEDVPDPSDPGFSGTNQAAPIAEPPKRKVVYAAGVPTKPQP